MKHSRGFVTRELLTPKRKQVYQFDFTPSRGNETPDTHPGLILTDARFNATGLAMVCSASHSLLGSAFAVEIPASRKLGFEGFFHPTHVRTIAYRERNPRLLGVMPDDLFQEIIQTIVDIIDPEESLSP